MSQLADLSYRYGHINILVNNASKQYMYKTFLDIELDRTEDMFKSNVIQMIAMSKWALPHMSRGDSYGLGLSTHAMSR